ncbi:hypothetical protein MNBD_GAMMA12-333 [hydrothermal vent metagenome]|uniref:Uncharacterized protein n=1 Tax=hydrothermal vent metagenome TaxID=652676 RepID=A0A3B0Y1X1_9ZZZZ
MKKIVVLVISLVLIIAVAGPFGSGFLVEERVSQAIGNFIEKLPRNMVKVEKFHRGWFKSSIVISLKEKKVYAKVTLNITHGPVLINKAGINFGLANIDLKLSGEGVKDKSIQFIKEILTRAQTSILLNYEKTMTVDVRLKKLLKPFKKDNIAITTINGFHYHFNMKLADSVGQRGKAFLLFDKIKFNYKNIKVVVGQFNSETVYNKSSKGAKTEDGFLTLNKATINYSLGAHSRQIMFNGIDLRSDAKIISNNLVLDMLFKVRTVEVPGFQAISLRLPLRVSNFNEESMAQYQKLTSTYPLNPLAVLRVVTKIIGGKPLIEINKAFLKVGTGTALLNFKLQGVPLAKDGIINMFNYRKIIDLHTDIVVPKTTLKELLKMASHLSADLNKTESEEKVNSQIKTWLDQHLITEKPKNYGFELKIEESKLFMNAERKKNFLFP